MNVTSDEDEDSESSGDATIVDIRTGAEHRDGFIIFEDYDETESDDDHIPGSNDSDSEDGDGSDFEDLDELQVDSLETNEIKIEADLLRISAILAEAQRVAVKLEQESDDPMSLLALRKSHNCRFLGMLYYSWLINFS